MGDQADWAWNVGAKLMKQRKQKREYNAKGAMTEC